MAIRAKNRNRKFDIAEVNPPSETPRDLFVLEADSMNYAIRTASLAALMVYARALRRFDPAEGQRLIQEYARGDYCPMCGAPLAPVPSPYTSFECGSVYDSGGVTPTRRDLITKGEFCE